jgi:phosphopantothenoylcysteine decarboxylase / phosphopantothenate---cysteine ligase
MLQNKKILLGITGSIAAKKCIDLIQILLEKKADVKVVLTNSAKYFVDYNAIKSILGSDRLFFAEDLFNPYDEMLHIKLARYPDIILIAPASANFIAKLAGGFADELLSSICLATNAKIAVSPAMNQQMWHNLFTQSNLSKIEDNLVEVIGPAEGMQACGEQGLGRMLEPHQIIEKLQEVIYQSSVLKGKRVVITAGPTIEKIDPVRYLSNFSSGKMGYELAKIASSMGAEVVLISGPTYLKKPANTQVEYIESANEMYNKVFEFINAADIFISSAAVADFTPKQVYNNKLKKDNQELHIDLIPTKDILKEVGLLKVKPYIVGFAAETKNVIANAQLKLKQKNLDMVIANDVSEGKVFGSDYNKINIITKDSVQDVEYQSKRKIAKIIMEFIVKEIDDKTICN